MKKARRFFSNWFLASRISIETVRVVFGSTPNHNQGNSSSVELWYTLATAERKQYGVPWEEVNSDEYVNATLVDFVDCRMTRVVIKVGQAKQSCRTVCIAHDVCPGG
jgi:hypothetical protein